MKFRIQSIAVLILLLVSLLPVFAQSGKIAGKVLDGSTGEALPFVNVMIEGTTQGAATDLYGNYFIINIPPGTYSVKA